MSLNANRNFRQSRQSRQVAPEASEWDNMPTNPEQVSYPSRQRALSILRTVQRCAVEGTMLQAWDDAALSWADHRVRSGVTKGEWIAPNGVKYILAKATPCGWISGEEEVLCLKRDPTPKCRIPAWYHGRTGPYLLIADNSDGLVATL